MRALYLLFLLLLIAPAQAALNITVVQHDTDIQSTYEHIKVCSCGTTVDAIRIKNLGDLESLYTFTLNATQPWFSLDYGRLYLAPGETQDIHVYTQAPCAAAGTASYTVFVASEYGRYRAVDKTIETGVCESVSATIQPTAVTVQPCATTPFNLTITNVGTFTDTFTVDSSLTQQSLELKAGESRSLNASYTAACNEWGTKTVPVTVKAQRNNLETTDEVTITVPRAYDFSIDVGTVRQPVCVGVPSNVTVSVHNSEERANTFTVMAGSEEQTVTVAGKNTQQVTLPYTPQTTGTNTLTVTATGTNGTIEKTTQTTIDAQACYGFTLTAPTNIQACPDTVHIPFTFESTGALAQQVAIDVQSNTTTAIDTYNFTLRAGQRIDKTVQVNIPDADRLYYTTLTAKSLYDEQAKTVAVQGFSTETCYRVAPTSHKFRVYTDATVLPVVIRHTGIEPATYNVSYNGTLLQPLESTLLLTPNTDTVVHFAVNATERETGRYVERVTLSSHGVDYTTDFEITLAEKGFWQQLLDAIRWNGTFGLCVVLSILALILFLIILGTAIGVWTGKIYYENPQSLSKETAGIVGALLLIVFLVLMIVTGIHLPRTYERPVGESNASALYYEIGQGDELRLAVDEYFSDPDADTLLFSANQPEHLKVRMEGSEAIVKARDDFAGQDTLVFTASDARGGVTDSELITVSVVPYKPVTFLQWWMASCWFLVWLFLFLATVTVLLTILFTPERKQHLKRNTKLTLYRKPRDLVVTEAQDLAKPAEGPAVATQVNAEKIIINQGAKDELWVASEDGTKFHRMTCPIIKNMPADKRVVFNTREDAIKAGYTPCKTCSSHE